MNAARIVSPSAGCVASTRRRSATGTTITSPASATAGGHEHAQTGEHVELAQEPAGAVLGDDALLAVGVEHDVDRAGHDHEEVVRGVSLSIQVLADRDRPSGPEGVERGELVVVERRSGGVSRIGQRCDLIARSPRRRLGPSDRVARVFAGVASCPPLAEEVPALVERDLDRRGAARARRPTAPCRCVPARGRAPRRSAHRCEPRSPDRPCVHPLSRVSLRLLRWVIYGRESAASGEAVASVDDAAREVASRWSSRARCSRRWRSRP